MTRSDLRSIALVIMIISIGTLAFTLAFSDRPSSSTSALSPPGPTVTGAPLPTSVPTPNPFTVSSTDETVTITRLWSPAPNLARAEGMASAETLAASFTIDGVAQPDVTISTVNGIFRLDLQNLEPGPQEICLSDACQRVLVSAPDQEDRPTIEALINEGVAATAGRFPVDRLLPDWTIEIGGPNSSAGGSTDPVTRIITIFANPGRSLDDYEITVLHELGHAVDTDFMTESSRQQFGDLRGHDPDLVWGPANELAVGDERWRNSAEDFAEVFVAWVLVNNYDIMSLVVAPQPTAGELQQFCVLIALDGIACE